jgi:dipeptidyl aminopeptidase/acylaminoacyl peptidase
MHHALRTLSILILLAAFISSPLLADDPKRPFTIEDFYLVQWLSGLDRSPDGSNLVYSLGATDLPRGKRNSDLWMVPAAGGDARRLTWTADASESEPAYSPDGEWIAFVAQRGEQTAGQIWLLPAKGGEAKSLTAWPTGVSGPRWSPDGRYIAFTSDIFPDCGADAECTENKLKTRKDGPLKAHLADELLYRHWTSWSDGLVTHVLLVDVASGAVRDLTTGRTEAPVFAERESGYAFSPDGKELCFTRNGDPAPAHAWSTNSDLWVVEVEPDEQGATRKARNITSGNSAWDGSPRYSPDGRYIAYLTQSRPGFEADLFQLALYDRESGNSRILAPGFDNWVEAFRWLPASDGIVFEAPLQGQTPLYMVKLKENAARKVADNVFIDEFVLDGAGERAYAVRRSIGMPPEVWLLGLRNDASPVRLTHHNATLEKEVDIRPAESIQVDDGEGGKIQVYLVKPHGFDPAKKYPLILNVHGGPQSQWANSFRGDWQVYPGAGYIVAFPNPHGSAGRGQPYVDRISRDWGGKVYDDLMRVTDALEKLPYVDRDRIGAMGWSYGGYMMNWFQGHTDRFKALANMMGIFDLSTFYYATEELWFPEWDLGLPWESTDYDVWNPAGSVENFKTPMLTITGELDFRIPYTQGLMAHTALRRRGISSRLIVLPESGHWPGWYEMALYYTAHLDWFHRYLDGGPAPWSVEDFVDNAVFDADSGIRIDREQDRQDPAGRF